MKKKSFSMLSFSLLALGQAAFAQDADTSRVSQLNTVVVTANKFAKKQSETGKVLTIISREQIERNVGRTVADVLNEQAGIVVNGTGSNPGKNKELYFRGATSSYTPILIDGIPVADATGLSGSAIDLRLLPIDEIERIEILRGTQSTLYGADAIAGVINIIMRKGSGKPIGASGNLTWGSNRSMKGTLGLSGQKDNVDYNVSFTHYETDGISEAAQPENYTGKRFDKDGYKQNALVANVGIQATEQLRLQPFLIYSDYNSKYDGGPFQDATVNSNKSNMLHSGVRSTYDIGKGKLYGNFGYQKVTREDVSQYGTTASDGRAYFAELYGHYDITNWLQLLAGVEYRKTELYDTTNQYSTAPYVSVLLKNLHGFNFEAGARYTMHSTFGNKFTYSINPSYLVSNTLKLFVNISSGFKTPTLTALYGPFGANPALKPEEANSYEAGFQAFLVKDKIDLRGVAFKRDLKNVITYVGNGYINYNKQNDRGVEVELNLHPVKDLSVKLFYAYVEGEVTAKSGTKDTTFNNLARRPNHSGGLNVSYKFCEHFTLGTNLRHIGSRYDVYYAPNVFTPENKALDAYTIWDMYAEYRFAGRNRLFINANNITNNKKYWEIYGYAVQGFNMQAGIAFSF